MDEMELGSQGFESNGVSAFYRAVLNSPHKATKEENTHLKSTISKSQDEEKEAAWDPAIPNLMMPMFNFDNLNYQEATKNLLTEGSTSSDDKKSYQNQMHAAVNHLLENWHEDLKKQAEISEKQADVKDLKQDRIQEGEQKKSLEKASFEKMVEIYLDREDIDDDQELAAAAGMLVISASFIGGVGGSFDVLDAGTINFNVISNTFQAVENFVPSDMRAELGLIAAYYASMASYQTALLNPSWLKGVSKGGEDIATAKEFAVVVIEKIRSNSFDRFLDQALAKKVHKTPLTDETLTSLKAMLKLTLIVTALGLVYKTEFGAVTHKELDAMIKGEMKIDPDSLESELVRLIQQEIKGVEKEKAAPFLETLLAHFDENPKIETLLKPSSVFRRLLKGDDDLPFSFLPA